MSNPRLADLEESLRETLSVDSVDELEDFPFEDYSEFIDALNEGRVEVFTGEDPEAFGALAGPGAKALYLVMDWSTFLVAGAFALGWLRLGNASLLWGIPLAFVGGWALSAPAFMRSLGLWLNRGLIAIAIYLWYQGTATGALLVSSYLVPNVLNHWLRHYSRLIFLRGVAESELVLVWLVIRGRLVPVVNAPARAKAARRRPNKALQPTSRAPRKAGSRKRSGAARG